MWFLEYINNCLDKIRDLKWIYLHMLVRRYLIVYWLQPLFRQISPPFLLIYKYVLTSSYINRAVQKRKIKLPK